MCVCFVVKVHFSLTVTKIKPKHYNTFSTF